MVIRGVRESGLFRVHEGAAFFARSLAGNGALGERRFGDGKFGDLFGKFENKIEMLKVCSRNC